LTDRAALARRSDKEDRSVWIPDDLLQQSDSTGPVHRWRNADIEELLARPPEQRPDFRRYLAHGNSIVAVNAAIALARLGHDDGAERLADAAGDPDFDLPMRCAAVEALAELQGPSVVQLLGKLADRYERHALDSPSSYDARLHAELIRGLARHVDVADDSRIADALKNREVEVRLAAIQAWSESRATELPPPIFACLDNADPRIRAAALLTIAKRGHAEAHSHLAAALQDHDFRVRSAAITGLGELGGEQSRAILEELTEDRVDRIRAGAVASLAKIGDKNAVFGATDDKSWRVRMQVARALAAYPDRDGITAARQLLQDTSSQVQQELIRMLTDWPLRQAGPILLTALGSRGLSTRESAAKLLAARWPPAAEFSPADPQQVRAAVLEDLQGQFQRQFGSVDQVALEPIGRDAQTTSEVTPPQLARIELLLKQRDSRALADFGPGLVEALERLVIDRQQLLPEFVYREVMPRYDPVFVAINRLASSDAWQRRRAADELAELAADRPLSQLALWRLGRVVVDDQDQLVWRGVLTAVCGDPREPAIRLARAAISHPTPEVRRRACENLAASPDPRHAEVLLPALEDPSFLVRCAAVRALGVAGRLQNTEPLRFLLRETNEELRLETALALVRLGDPTGKAELERLAHSTDPTIGHRVAVSIGETGDATFLPTLIAMLDGRTAVARAALESLPKVVGRDMAETDDQRPTGTSQRIERWKSWYSNRQTGQARRGFSTPESPANP